MSLSFKPTQDALKNLEEALKIQNPNDLERDGTVQRFEHSYEILWKLAQKVLQEHEVRAEFPKAVFRELGRLGWINNVEAWIEFQQARNESSHEYGVKYANTSCRIAMLYVTNPGINSLI
jgi:nucleotidyltransferase substrate binding protein (TIGR01987 family)